mmetsp:Transcript_8411/g.7536  ORF Transcript_8411/g.7536 Transcript_8411/m.7536 type:complete len:232 (-) Transcript_8411:249-944(-)
MMLFDSSEYESNALFTIGEFVPSIDFFLFIFFGVIISPFSLLPYFKTRCNVEFHLFLIALSVLPGNSLAISAHLLPLTLCSSIIILSSSSVHGDLLISGFKWLYHLSRHCFPNRPFSCRAMNDQLFTPYDATKLTTQSSSSCVHGPFIRPGRKTFCHLCRHCTSVLASNKFEIFFQFLPPFFSTASRNISSSSTVHFPLVGVFDILSGASLIESNSSQSSSGDRDPEYLSK